MQLKLFGTKNKKIVWGTAFLLLLLICVFVWRMFFSKQEVQYLIETVQRGNIRQTVSASGEISASRLVDVGAQASGQVKKLYVHLGQKVKKGQLIAHIDSTTQKNNLSTAYSKLQTYQAQLNSKKIALRIAKKNYEREKELWEKNATSRKELETAEDTLSTTTATIAELNASIKQAKISLSTAKTNLGYTRIVAPFSGTVVSTPTEEGQTVNSVQSSPTIVQIANLETMIIKMQIAEGDVTKVKKGMDVIFTTLAEPNVKRKAVLQSVDPGLTLLSRGSYTEKTDLSSSAIYYFARAVVSNPDGNLHIGMTTQNTIIVKEVKNVLMLPTVTIKIRGEKYYVRVLNEKNEVQEKFIVIGVSDTMNTQIVSGLSEGEKVISAQMSQEEIDSAEPARRGRGR